MTQQESREDRLRRELRALSAVNRQLQAQLEGERGVPVSAAAHGGDLVATPVGYLGGGAGSLRRTSLASAWLQQLELESGGDAFLVRTPRRGAFVVEGSRRREVKGGVLAAALERALGAAREVGDDELERWTEGAPVEVLEGPTGPAFVVVGGQRLPLRGLPLPHPVNAREMQLFPEGPELNVGAANVPRAWFEHAVSGRYHLERVRTVLRREGPLRGGSSVAKRVAGRLRRSSKERPAYPPEG